MTPFILESGNTHLITLDVFSRLQKDRIVFLGMEIDNDVANTIIAQLLYLDSQSHEPIQLYLNTPGGSVSAGLAIYDTMNIIKSPVNTICVGMAASMGSILLVNGKTRSILPHSRVLIHQPSGWTEGKASDMLIDMKELEKMKKELCQILADKTKQSYDQIWNDFDRDRWFDAEEAVSYGLVDKIVK